MSPAPDPVARLARELELPPAGVGAVLHLLDDGNTVPFIARYRKEATGSLDEVQIRAVAERRAYLAELDKRRAAVLESIAEQGSLDEALRARIAAAATKAELEDLYLPYKPKRRTRATIARERGLEPLAERILAQPAEGDAAAEAAAFVDAEREVPDAAAALAGARDIVAERVAERAGLRAMVREAFAARGRLVTALARGGEKRDPEGKFRQYHQHAEPVARIPSHRYLAIRRGEREKVLRVHIEVEAEPLLARLFTAVGLQPDTPFGGELRRAVEDAYQRLLAPGLETEVRGALKERADREAVEVFAANLDNLLLAPPLGARPVLGVDPGLRTGCKLAAVDASGRLRSTGTLFLARSAAERERAAAEVRAVAAELEPAAVAVGNGTGGREAEAFLRGTLEGATVVQVSEAGASVYSASELARAEFPDQDVTVRGAISIARRLQDPLAELVKIEPKAIGVGQYQHDVHQPLLARKLDEVVESCVNRVGVELNTASAPLLARVAGIGARLAERIVAQREQSGRFGSRQALRGVAGLGDKTFEQAAGFLRIRDGAHPLDASAVHPERYGLVERMARDLGVELAALVGDAAAAGRIAPERYAGDGVGEPTLRDILAELAKPGRDPRDRFEPVRFRDDVQAIGDLRAGMQLEGVVTNVTAFGAFVDIGVHRDGLVHISELADRFVRDPHQVVRVGDRLSVRVLDVDQQRKRISLSARQQTTGSTAGAGKDRPARAEKPAATGKSGQSGKSSKSAKPPRSSSRTRPDRPTKRRSDSSQQDTGLTHNPFAELLKKG